jgi:GT2 family glycosyltransferase
MSVPARDRAPQAPTQLQAPATAAGSPTLAMVTVLYNCEKHLPLFFECMGRQIDRDFVVIVIDNASRDASLVRARELAALHRVPCEFIANADNLGISVGNNQGIERAFERGWQHIVLINNDIGCGDDLLAQIRRRAVDAKVPVWTCLSWADDTDRRWYGGGELVIWRGMARHWPQSRSEAVSAPIAVSYAPTCLMYVHASVFRRVGLMDARYFVYYDDTDFCFRLRAAGVPLLYDPDVQFRHYAGGSTGGPQSEFFVRITTRNQFIYIAKHHRGLARWAITAVALAPLLAKLCLRPQRAARWRGLREAWSGNG